MEHICQLELQGGNWGSITRCLLWGFLSWEYWPFQFILTPWFSQVMPCLADIVALFQKFFTCHIVSHKVHPTRKVKYVIVCFNLCLLCKNPDSDTKWESSGLEITPLQPMHRWSLTYKGKMIAKRTGMSHNVDISVRSRFIQVKVRYQLFYIC